MSRRRWVIGAFCSIYFIVQMFLILSSYQKADKRFGFWMFPESTYFQMKLERELASGAIVEAERGRWSVHAAGLGGETGRVSSPSRRNRGVKSLQTWNRPSNRTVSKPHLILIKARRDAQPCAHKPRFISR